MSMSENLPTIHSITQGGVAAEHVPIPAPQVLVAPTHSSKEHNTIKASLVPFACWRAHDLRFEFESSFVLPEINAELAALKELIDRHTLTDAKGQGLHKPALTVFGHADPTGSDDFNKALSGRRAQAIYGMLVRKTELWEDLYSNPLGNDKWEPKAIHILQSTLGQPLSDHPSKGARAALFQAYMDHVCTVRDEVGQPELDEQGQPVRLELKPTDFLAGGANPRGKGDYQGCGEFNPILVFSADENKDFSDPKKKDQRDGENAPNRRVLVFLFRPGVRISSDSWPCPSAKEGAEGCKKRFWSDADKRRKCHDKRREFKDTQDTFACRFYDRLSNNSPCERGLATFEIRLYDPAGRFIAEAPFEAQVGLRKPITGTATENGGVLLQDLEIPNRVVLRWGLKAKPGQKPELDFGLDMFLTHENLSPEAEAKQKLHNLGYPQAEEPLENITAFQRDYGHLAKPPLPLTGKLDDPTMNLIRKVYDTCGDDLRNTPPK